VRERPGRRLSAETGCSGLLGGTGHYLATTEGSSHGALWHHRRVGVKIREFVEARVTMMSRVREILKYL
jgi:hypothetical protein